MEYGFWGYGLRIGFNINILIKFSIFFKYAYFIKIHFDFVFDIIAIRRLDTRIFVFQQKII